MADIGTPFNILAGLPILAWRSLTPPPYDAINFSGGHAQAKRKYPNLDAATHQHMGRDEIPMSFRLLFFNRLEPDSFPDNFQAWFDAFALDGSPGELFHPLLGLVDCVPISWQVEAIANRTDGVAFTLTWEETVTDITEPDGIAGVIVSAKAVAEVADNDLSKNEFDFPDNERTTSLTDMISQIEGAIFSARLTLNGVVNQAKGIIDRMIRVVDAANSHENWAILANLRTLYDKVEELGVKTAAAIPRPIGVFVTTAPETLSSLSGQLDNDVGELIALNPLLLGAPGILKGSPVNYFVAL